jgi:hypothetical protein
MQTTERAHDGTPIAALSLARAERLSDAGELGDRCSSSSAEDNKSIDVARAQAR